MAIDARQENLRLSWEKGDARDPRRQNRFWLGADLVVEVVSEDDPERDTKVKRADYASAGIPEYWIVNPLDNTITVLVLEGTASSAVGTVPCPSSSTGLM